VGPGRPVLKPVGSADEIQLPAAAPYVRSGSGPATKTIGRETRWVLTDERTGARSARVTAVERTGPENPGTPASRDNDRLVVVTEGELTAEIAAQQTAVPAPAVIVIPAGVPHRIRNSSPAPVRNLDADVPTPDVYAKLAAG
jgi:mannose-6-phosphate isomerase-like protein (cupin superfamily)